MDKLEAAKAHFAALVEEQLARVERMKNDKGAVDYSKLDKIIIGCCGGDGIGPAITAEAERVLRAVLKDDVANGKIVFKQIDGLTIEIRIGMSPLVYSVRLHQTV